MTSGLSGAELANIVNEASLLAARRNQDVVTQLELLEGLQRTRYGVDGRSATGSGFSRQLQSWLMDMAVGGNSRQVKVGTAGS